MGFFSVFSEPTDIDLDDEEYGLIILRAEDVDGEQQLVTIDDDNELDAVYQAFMESLFEEEEE